MNVPPPPGLTRVQAKEQNRRKLLEAARLELIERGYAGLSARQVSARAGVAQSSFYAHFADKEALVETLAGEIVVPFRERLKRARMNSEPGDWMALWKATWQEVHSLFLEERDLIRILFQELDQPGSPMHALGEEIFDTLHREFREDLGTLVERGHLPPLPLEALTCVFMGTATYLLRRLLWGRVPDPEALQEELIMLGQMLQAVHVQADWA